MRAFLTDRTATLGIGPLRSDTFRTPPKGTPQGSVISPLLFNIALLKLPPLLQTIPGLHHALYADDLTLWTTTGSPGTQQDTLQQAIDTILAYLRPRGLTCAPSKSALLILRSRTRGRCPVPTPDPAPTIGSTPIPKVHTLRILGVQFHQDGSGAAVLPHLQATVTQLTHLIKRITNQRQGLKEDDTIRLIQALLISRITYSTPYIALKPREREKVDILIRKAFKIGLGLPAQTSTCRFFQLGIHNTLEELLEAQRNSQLTRLLLTSTGRHVLQVLGYPTPPASQALQRIPSSIRSHITVSKIPNNMHPEFNQGRRLSRVKHLRS